MFKYFLANLSIKAPLNFCFKLQVTTAICPFKTLVKLFFNLIGIVPLHVVLVTSVVPHLYCPPESINKISIENHGQGSGSNFYVDNLQISVVPEPMSVGLVGVVCVAGTFIRRKFVI